MKIGVRIACVTLLVAASPLWAQEILFDQMVEAGGLKCYPVYGDDTSWYYLPDQPHVAADDTDRPQFSYLMYSMPEQRGEEGITSAPGGGIAHFLVAYDVPRDMVRRAQSELSRTRPGAQLKGPVAYTDGTFNLVTSVTDPEAGLSRRVVGVGNAPIMSGHKAAVSMHLTPTGAMLLWESFSQRTPDISVNFEMTVSGYRNPVEAEMTFNYQRIHQTMELEAGIESSFLEADVEVMLGKMVDNGSISIELKGAPPEQWQEVQKLGLELAKHHLFENLGAAPLSQVRELTRTRSRSSGRGSGSSRGGGDEAGGVSGDGDDSNRRSALEFPFRETIVMFAAPPPDEEEAQRLAAEARTLYDEGRYRQALTRLEEAYEEEPVSGVLFNMALCHLRLGERDEGLENLDGYLSEEGLSSAAITQARQAIEDAPESMFSMSPSPTDRQRRGELIEQLRDAVRAAGGAGESAAAATSAAADITGDRAGEPSGASDASGEGTGIGIRDQIDDDEDDRIPLRDLDFEAEDEPELRRIAPPDRRRRLRSDEDEDPIRLTVALRFRRIERSGSFTLSMKQWNRVEIPVRFAANIGDLSRYMDDSRMFRRVSLNDPMFRQREIPVTVDVASEEAFAAMLNAVTVTLRKRHQSGAETLDEVTIQRSDFSSGELETMLYGWDGDDNRTRWLDYEHRVQWNYLGGPVIETDWQRSSAGALVLSPPLRPREVTLEADPVVLREQGVRDVVVEVAYPAAGAERKAHATVRPSDEVGRHVLTLYQDPQSPDYSYSFDWRMYGGRRVEAGPFEDTADYIYLDEIPRE
jgi:hypothetical protein